MDWEQIRALGTFETVGAWSATQQIVRTEQSEAVDAAYASSSYFSVLGIAPALGRTFTDEDDSESTDNVILTHLAWRRYFGGREDVVGQRLTLASHPDAAGRPMVVVGVLGPSVSFPGHAPELLLPLGHLAYAGTFPENRLLRLLGRLRPGVSVSSVESLAPFVVGEGATPGGKSARLVDLDSELSGRLHTPMSILFGGSVLLLVLACSSVGGILLVDMRQRRGETAIQLALGASGSRLLRQFLGETLVIGALAVIGGTALGVWLTEVLAIVAPKQLQSFGAIRLDPVVVLLICCALVGILAVFAVVVSFQEIFAKLRPAASGQFQRCVVAGQVAFAVFLVSTAAMFGHAFLALRSAPLGFEPQGVALAQIRLVHASRVVDIMQRGSLDSRVESIGSRSAALARSAGAWRQTAALLSRIEALPGVTAAAASSNVPFSAITSRFVPFSLEGDNDGVDHTFLTRIVSERYFEVLRVPLESGRVFSPEDRSIAAPQPVVVSSAAQTRSKKFEQPGARLSTIAGGYPHIVVGVVGHSRERPVTINSSEPPAMYFLNLRPDQVRYLLVRVSGNVSTMLPALREAIEEFDPGIKVMSTASLATIVDDSVAGERFRAALSSIFGGCALVLAAIGLFGLAVERVAQRQSELAIRAALGAPREALSWLIVRETGLTALVGTAIGLAASVALSILARALMHDVTTLPLGFLALVVVATLATCALAIAGPAWRAGRVEAARLVLR
jgi:hypothetical protein